MKHAIATLKARVPLGATDVPDVLRTAVESLNAATSKRAKSIIFIGDGMSTAHYMSVDDYRKLLDTIVTAQVSVTSFAIGPRLDTQLLASLANQTGGMLAVDGEDLDAKQFGVFLASSVHGTVLWPKSATWPKEFVDVYPAKVPPLRTDRDTIVIGKAQGKLLGDVQIALTLDGGKSPLTWTLTAGESNLDFAYLPALVEAAHGDGGLRLTTVGSQGLQEVKRNLDESVNALAKLEAKPPLRAISKRPSDWPTKRCAAIPMIWPRRP